MGRRRTGCAQWDEDAGTWIAWLTIGEVGHTHRERVEMRDKRTGELLVPKHEGCSCTNKAPCAVREQAEAFAAVLAKRAVERGAVDASTGETVAEYAARWLRWREQDLKLASSRNDRAVIAHYLDAIALTPMATVTRNQIEDVRDGLDRRVQTGELAWKTAVNTWGIIGKMFRDAHRSKNRALRVRDDNPCVDVEGPDRGSKRAKQFLWPAMFLAFVSDDRIPLAWRRLLALSTYLYVRPEELAALEWEDVRIEESTVLVHRALELGKGRGKVKTTKTGDTRRVTIEPTLRPLLEAMKREADGKGLVIKQYPPQSQLARVFRRYLGPALELAGIEARDLFTADATRMRIDWRRATRDTGITWRAVRGDSPAKIMRAAGHRDVKTTMLYVIEAEGFAAGFGAVFPELPASLLGGDNVGISSSKDDSRHECSQKGSDLVGAAGFEPATSTV